MRDATISLVTLLVPLRLSWWGALAFAHRWLGITGGLLFIVWFVSGIAMMYVRMPSVTLDERLARAVAIEPTAIRVSPSEAANAAGISSPGPFQLTMLGARPVYRFTGRTPATIYADRPEKPQPLHRKMPWAAREPSRRSTPAPSATTD